MMIPASRAVHCLLPAIAMVMLICAGLSAASDPETDLVSGAGDRVQSLRDLRFHGMIEQSSTSSCGAAAVAMLSSLCLGVTVTEDEARAVVEASVRARGRENTETEAVTALDLRAACRALGLDLRGFRVTPSALWDYFLQGGLPVIVHGTHPHPHFLTVLGRVVDELVVADPSWGQELLPLDVFVDDKGFSGVVLVPVPTSDRVETARGAQAAVLLEAEKRRVMLRDLRVALP
ncbi:peptidase C39 bacteriocin processing [Candidatus Bipolaricaulota bacterium]|nr:peptidase C39 bacteriocin processing [Candidatus Bipolaricaulota bacterium]